MQEMERLQAKGEVNEEVLHAMEEDMTGKVRISCHVLFYVQLLSPCIIDLTCLLAGNPFRSRASTTRGKSFLYLRHRSIA